LDLAQLFPYILFLHILGAIVAFGPTFAYSIMGGMAGKEPQHANFSSRQVASIGRAIVYPLAIVQGITGLLLIASGKLDVTTRLWLEIAIVLYLILVGYGLTVQRNALHKLIEMTSTPPPPGTPPGPPPPEVLAQVKKVQRGGMFLGLLIVVIVFLMVLKPTF
jgi:cytochrome c biogenesis protein CcdA